MQPVLRQIDRSLNMRAIVAAAILLTLLAEPSRAETIASSIPEWACKEMIERSDDPLLYEIVDEVFYGKFADLQSNALLPPGFVTSPDPRVIVCRNYLYSALLLKRDPPLIVLDIQFFGFLYAQSRALILGQYIADNMTDVDAMELHKMLISEVVAQGKDLEYGLGIVESLAARIGASDAFVKATLAEPRYDERELGLFLHALHFFFLHERCHLFLDNGDGGSDALSSTQREINADECAIEIINKDELQYSGSPISIVATLLTVASHAVLELAIPELYAGTGTHPSASDRFTNAALMVKEYVLQNEGDLSPELADFVSRLSEYFATLIAEHK